MRSRCPLIWTCKSTCTNKFLLKVLELFINKLITDLYALLFRYHTLTKMRDRILKNIVLNLSTRGKAKE